MRITFLEQDPIHRVRFLNAGRGAGNFFTDELPIHLATMEGMPDDLDAIVVTADLQGRETFKEAAGAPLRLLGEVLPSRLVSEILPSIGLHSPERMGVLLAGDFYTVPALDKRGGTGDVTPVWNAFGSEFSWVIGVAGNHDAFCEKPGLPPRFHNNLRFLDGSSTSRLGIRISGLSGVIGDSDRPWRRSESNFNLELECLLETHPDIVLMHDGPSGTEISQRGSESTRHLLERSRSALIIRGHAHWDSPLCEFTNGTQILNVDCRVVVCRR